MRGIEAEAEFCDAICSGGQPEPRRGSSWEPVQCAGWDQGSCREKGQPLIFSSFLLWRGSGRWGQASASKMAACHAAA
jgi:hypothetical protein